jgi:hypothetical protein
MTQELAKDIPRHYIILSVVIGFILMVLSPLRFYLPYWLNPFIVNNASEKLSIIAIILVSSFFVGLPGLFLRNLIIGSGGLNDKLNLFNKPRIEILKQSYRRSIKVMIWLKKNDLESTVSFLYVKYAFVSGILIGIELAFFGNFIAISARALLYNRTLGNLFIQKRDFCNEFYLVISLILFVVIYSYDRFFFRGASKKELEAIEQLYKESQE